MKKIYQLAATAVLAVLAIGASAQTPGTATGLSKSSASNPDQALLNRIHANPSYKSTDRVETITADGYLDNYVGDIVANPSAQFASWIPFLIINSQYTLADTMSAIAVANSKGNQWTATSVVVTFDTLFDLYAYAANQNVTFQGSPYAGSVTVDTVSAFFHYHNTSGVNDTIVITILKVAANGTPTGTTYAASTKFIVVPGGATPTFKYNKLDSIQRIQIPLAIPVAIPSSARKGWNFAVQLSVNGSKQDTIGVYYSSQAAVCGAGDIASAYTSVGAPLGRASAVNSYINGLYWYNDINNHGTGGALTWPVTAGSYAGWYMNGGNYYWDDNPVAPCGDTGYWPVQDIGIFPSINYNPAGVNEVSANSNFSINQNMPNPFNQSTQITYNLVKASDVTFSVYDLTGRELINNSYSTVAPGKHAITLEANQFTPGIYFYTFNVGGTAVTRKMVITQ